MHECVPSARERRFSGHVLRLTFGPLTNARDSILLFAYSAKEKEIHWLNFFKLNQSLLFSDTCSLSFRIVEKWFYFNSSAATLIFRFILCFPWNPCIESFFSNRVVFFLMLHKVQVCPSFFILDNNQRHNVAARLLIQLYFNVKSLYKLFHWEPQLLCNTANFKISYEISYSPLVILLKFTHKWEL